MSKKSIGEFIAALRKANGLTQQDVGDRLNVSNKAVSRWERDECAPDISLIPALAELLGVSCDELLRGERILNAETQERKEQKTDKQIKNLINRTLSSFKMLIWIALATSAVGLILMFGIAYGFYRPIVGFTAMLLFEAGALTVTIAALTRAKDMKRDNELFESADAEQISRFNRVLGKLSFNALFCVFACVAASMPFVIVGAGGYINAVINFKEYLTVLFGLIAPILVLIYLSCKKPLALWISGREDLSESKKKVNVKCVRMSAMQLSLLLLASIAFVVSPSFDTDYNTSTLIFSVLILVGVALMIASVIYFCVFIIRNKAQQKEYLLSGIRNICLLPTALILCELHSVAWGWENGFEGPPQTRIDLWTWEYFWYALIYFLIVFTAFELLRGLLNLKKKKA